MLMLYPQDEKEHFFACPYCWREISMLLDTSVRRQTYIEDCENCCNPIKIHYETEAGMIVDFRAQATDG